MPPLDEQPASTGRAASPFRRPSERCLFWGGGDAAFPLGGRRGPSGGEEGGETAVEEGRAEERRRRPSAKRLSARRDFSSTAPLPFYCCGCH